MKLKTLSYLVKNKLGLVFKLVSISDFSLVPCINVPQFLSIDIAKPCAGKAISSGRDSYRRNSKKDLSVWSTDYDRKK